MTAIIKIEKQKWTVTRSEFNPPNGVSLTTVYTAPNWGVGPVEVARILKRLGVVVSVQVEPGELGLGGTQ